MSEILVRDHYFFLVKLDITEGCKPCFRLVCFISPLATSVVWFLRMFFPHQPRSGIVRSGNLRGRVSVSHLLPWDRGEWNKRVSVLLPSLQVQGIYRRQHTKENIIYLCPGSFPASQSESIMGWRIYTSHNSSIWDSMHETYTLSNISEKKYNLKSCCSLDRKSIFKLKNMGILLKRITGFSLLICRG